MTEFRIRDLANSESESVRRQCGMADSSVEGPEGRQKVAHGASRGAEERLGLIQPRRGGRTCLLITKEIRVIFLQSPFACHSERSEESPQFAQGKLREASLQLLLV